MKLFYKFNLFNLIYFLFLLLIFFNTISTIKSQNNLNNLNNHFSTNRKLKIIVTSASMGWSHMQFQGRLADILIEAGHEVVKNYSKLTKKIIN